MGEFEGDCCATERFEGIRAVRLCRIEDCNGLGNADDPIGKVVVGDDEVHAEGFGLFCCGEGADAGIDADDEANP